MTTSIEALMQRLNERTTERDYHIGVSDILAARIAALEAALREIANWPPSTEIARNIARAALAEGQEKP